MKVQILRISQQGATELLQMVLAAGSDVPSLPVRGLQDPPVEFLGGFRTWTFWTSPVVQRSPGGPGFLSFLLSQLLMGCPGKQSGRPLPLLPVSSEQVWSPETQQREQLSAPPPLPSPAHITCSGVSVRIRAVRAAGREVRWGVSVSICHHPLIHPPIYPAPSGSSRVPDDIQDLELREEWQDDGFPR